MLSRYACVLALSFAASISLNAQSLVTDIAVPGSPSGVAVNPANNRIYAGLVVSGTYSLAVIDGTTNTVLQTVPLTTGSLVDAVNVVTGRIYVAGCTYQQIPVTCGLSVIDGNTNAVITTIPFNSANGIGLEGIAVNPVTNRIYVADSTNFMIDVINGATNTIMTTVPMGRTQPLGLAFDFGTDELAVTINGGALWILSGSTNKFVRQIAVGTFNANTAVNSFSSQAFVTNEQFQPSTLGVVNIVTGKVEAKIAIGNAPFGVGVDLFTDLAFVSNKGDNTVAMVNGKTNKKVSSLSVSNPSSVDVNPVTRLVYVSDSVDDLVHVISE